MTRRVSHAGGLFHVGGWVRLPEEHEGARACTVWRMLRVLLGSGE